VLNRQPVPPLRLRQIPVTLAAYDSHEYTVVLVH
jgi:hypothetical protein